MRSLLPRLGAPRRQLALVARRNGVPTIAPRVHTPGLLVAKQPLISARRHMALLPGLPLLLKVASVAKQFKIFSSWGSILITRRSSEQALWWRALMRRITLGTAVTTGAGTGIVYATSQEEIAVSGRKRLLLTTREEEMEYADTASLEMLNEFPKDKVLLVRDLDGHAPSTPVRRGFFRGASAADVRNHRLLQVASRIVGAVKASPDLPAGVEQLRWRLHLIDDDETHNAFVLPNGHVRCDRRHTPALLVPLPAPCPPTCPPLDSPQHHLVDRRSTSSPES